MALQKDLTGQRFGKLTVIGFDHKTPTYQYMWKCKCDCGNNHIANRSGLKNGNIQSCGCLMGSPKHNLSGTRFDKIFWNMKSRCTNQKHASYENYGARGIKCHWGNFQDFINDMYEQYLEHCEEFGEKDTFIDRIDNDGDYTKENCKWSTRKENNNNRRKRKYFRKPI